MKLFTLFHAFPKFALYFPFSSSVAWLWQILFQAASGSVYFGCNRLPWQKIRLSALIKKSLLASWRQLEPGSSRGCRKRGPIFSLVARGTIFRSYTESKRKVHDDFLWKKRNSQELFQSWLAHLPWNEHISVFLYLMGERSETTREFTHLGAKSFPEQLTHFSASLNRGGKTM